jgi:hypothetical protein
VLRVHSLSPAGVRDLFQVRGALEGLAVTLLTALANGMRPWRRCARPCPISTTHTATSAPTSTPTSVSICCFASCPRTRCWSTPGATWRVYRRLRETLDKLDTERGTSGSRLFYLARPPEAFDPVIDGLAGAGLNRPPDGSFPGSLSRSRTGMTSAAPRRWAIGCTRPLRSRRCSGSTITWAVHHPKCAGAAVRHRDLRADLKPELGGSRADHRRRDSRRRHSRQLLRARLRHSRHPAEPRATSTGAGADGAASLVWGRGGPQREGQAAAVDPAADCERHRPDRRPRPIHPRRHRGRTHARLPGRAGRQPARRTETYAALRLDVDNWRWAGVPFYIRTGKRLPKRITEVVLQFQRPPHPADPARPSYRALAGRADPADPAGPLPAAGELRRWQRAACRVGTAGLRAMLGGAAPEPLDVLVGVPTDTENASRSPCSATVVHQKVPLGVSVYCWYGLVQSGCSKTRPAVQNRQTR